jgi:hypothetical protein
MGLIVENGSQVPNANSYETLAGVRAYAANRGVVLSVDDPTLTGQLILACDFLESFTEQYVGRPTSFSQALSWPRSNVQFDPDSPFPNNAIPTALIQAQDEAVIAISAGVVLQPNVDYSKGGFVIEKKVDVLLTKYSEMIGTTTQPLLPKVMAKLQLLLNPMAVMQTVRV